MERRQKDEDMRDKKDKSMYRTILLAQAAYPHSDQRDNGPKSDVYAKRVQVPKKRDANHFVRTGRDVHAGRNTGRVNSEAGRPAGRSTFLSHANVTVRRGSIRSVAGFLPSVRFSATP